MRFFMVPVSILVCSGLFLCCNAGSSQSIKKITKVNSLNVRKSKERHTKGLNDLAINIAVPIGISGQPEEETPVVINFENSGSAFAIDTGTVLKNGTDDVSADFSDCFGDVPSGRSSCYANYFLTSDDISAGMVTFDITLSSSGEMKDYIINSVPLGTYISDDMKVDGVVATNPYNPVKVFAGETVPVEITITNVESENITDVVIADKDGTVIGEAEVIVPDESVVADTKIEDSTFDVIETEYTIKLTNTEDIETYRLYTLYTESITGTYRINWGCLCDDSETTHILVGSYNDGVNNAIKGWEFDEGAESCAALASSINLGNATILSKAVYNTVDSFDNNVIYLAYVTQAPEQDCVLNLAKCWLNGDSYEFTIGNTTGLSLITSKVQWILDNNDIPYVAVDCDDEMRVYPIDVSDLSFGTYFSTANKSLGNASTFLYWFPQGMYLYLLQGYGAATVSTYKVNLLTHSIEAGVDTNLSGTFSQVNACATCYNYLILGGSNTEVSKNGILKQYTVKTTDPNKGSLVAASLMETIETTSTVNYCELCCCAGSNLLVGTDKGLFSYAPDTLSLISSNTLLPNNNWNNTCWCCMNNDYCVAIDNEAQAYILKQESGSFIVTCTL